MGDRRSPRRRLLPPAVPRPREGGDLAGGLPDLDRAIRKELRRIELRPERGAALERLGRYVEAALEYERVADLDPVKRDEYLEHAGRTRGLAQEGR